MKKIFVFLFIFSFCKSIFSQQHSQFFDFQEYKFEKNIEFSQNEYLIFKKNVQKNIEILAKKDVFKNFFTKTSVKFRLPLREKSGIQNYGFYSISAYFDHDTLYPNSLKDFNCQQFTYDTQDGYNHAGTDFFTFPFPWNKMENDEVEVIAAANGIIVYKQDGNRDKNCEAGIDIPFWNVIVLQHSDGTLTYYGHLKKNSVTQNNVGEMVSAGDYLGVVGSSGSSSTPHLHFEVNNEKNEPIDPFSGECGDSVSLWETQKPYVDAGINQITTNFAYINFQECPNSDILNLRDTFSLSDTIFFSIFFRNISLNDTVSIKMISPSQTLWDSWVWNCPYPFFAGSYLQFWAKLFSSDVGGNWKIEANYKGKTYEKAFFVQKSSEISQNLPQNIEIGPNPASEILTVKNVEAKNLRVKLISLQGICVFERYFSEKNIEISLKNFARGIYFLQICSEKDFQNYKIFVK